MRKTKMNLVYFISIFCLSGCASLDTLTYFESYSKMNNWNKSSIYYNYANMNYTLYWNSYEDEHLKIFLSPRPEFGRSIAISFSYLPIMFPNIFSYAYAIFSPENDSLIVEAYISSYKGKAEINLSKSKFTINNKEYTPIQIFTTDISSDTTTYTIYARKPNYYGLMEANIYKYNSGTLSLGKDGLYVIFQLPIMKTKADEIIIKLSTIKTEDKEFEIKDLILKKERIYIYDPGIFSRALNH